MGRYIEVPQPKNKADQIIALYGATELPDLPNWEEVPYDKALIAVVQNGNWDAALYVEDPYQYFRVACDQTERPVRFLYMDRSKAEELINGTR
jgi:hypothetical protein